VAVLVTGGAGYIGSITVEFLRNRGESVVVLDNLSRGHRAAVNSNVVFYEGDVGDRVLVARITKENEIESCIHFAAFAYVGESVQDPRKYFENNVEQGIALIGALHQAGVTRIVLSSSCATYGTPEHLPICETARQLPVNPYGWSKLLLERALASYDLSYGMRFVALRYFNAAGATQTLGEHHSPETHLIANALRTALGKQKEVSVFGDSYPTPDGTAIRDYVHVSDLAEAHASALAYLRRGKDSEFLNLASGRGYSVLEVIECARQVTGKTITVRIEPPRLGDPPELIADPSKAKQVLGWTATESDLTSIIRSAWEWHFRHPEGYASS
jgi:UDP-glucose 4-epimerase